MSGIQPPQPNEWMVTIEKESLVTIVVTLSPPQTPFTNRCLTMSQDSKNLQFVDGHGTRIK